jgi:hypothetical protein
MTTDLGFGQNLMNMFVKMTNKPVGDRDNEVLAWVHLGNINSVY